MKLEIDHLLITMDMKIPTKVFLNVLDLTRQLIKYKMLTLALNDPVFVLSLLA